MDTLPSPSREHLLATIRFLHARAIPLVTARNAAYAGPRGDVFGNLSFIEALSDGMVTTEMGIVIRMTDKIARSWTLTTTTGREGDEKLEDTMLDLIGYLSLLILRIRSRDPVLWREHLALIEPHIHAHETPPPLAP